MEVHGQLHALAALPPWGGGVLSNHSIGSYVATTPVWTYQRRENLLFPPEIGPDSSVIQLTILPLYQLHYHTS